MNKSCTWFKCRTWPIPFSSLKSPSAVFVVSQGRVHMVINILQGRSKEWEMPSQKEYWMPDACWRHSYNKVTMILCKPISGYAETSAAFWESEYNWMTSRSDLPIHSLSVSSVMSNTVRANAIAVGVAVSRIDHSRVTARPRATRIMMNNWAMP